MERVVAAFSTKQRLRPGVRTRGEDNFIHATLSNFDQPARGLLGILQRTVQRGRPWQNIQPTITTKPRSITNRPRTSISRLEGL